MKALASMLRTVTLLLIVVAAGAAMNGDTGVLILTIIAGLVCYGAAKACQEAAK